MPVVSPPMSGDARARQLSCVRPLEGIYAAVSRGIVSGVSPSKAEPSSAR